VTDELVGHDQEAGGIDRATLLKRVALGSALMSIPGLAGAGEALAAGDVSLANVFPKHPKWKFAFINHVTTNPFFVPTQYGASDAAKMTDTTYTWTGSTKADVAEMINAFNAAVSAKADGIAVCVVDKAAFEAPIKRAQRRGIPVLAYNADGARTGAKARSAYIGQDLYVSGFEMGKRIVELVPSGDVAIFIATPGALNIQPRIDGALDAIKQSGKPINAKAVATDPDLATELSMIDAYYVGHKSLKGMFAVDAGDTQAVGQVIQKYNLKGKVKGGGYDLLPGTLKLVASGNLEFTIDQQPYLQGFFPVLELYLYKVSQTLTGMADVNTGLKFLDKTTVIPYNSTKSRYEGTATGAGVQKS